VAFLNSDGTLNVSQMLADANKGGGGSKLPDGAYTCRLLSAEIQDAKGAEKAPLPGKKNLAAKFTIMSGEHEKAELYLSYALFNKSEKVGSGSGTVRFFSDLNAIGEGYVDGKGVKITFDKDGNMGVLTKTGPSVEALKKLWMTAFAGKFVSIQNEMQQGDDKKTGRKFEYALRTVVGLANAATTEDELPDDVPEDDEAAY
jgi:hypothetical protein